MKKQYITPVCKAIAIATPMLYTGSGDIGDGYSDPTREALSKRRKNYYYDEMEEELQNTELVTGR